MQTSTLSASFRWLLAALLLLGGRAAWAQAPTFSPASGPAGTSVILTGSGFSGATSVRFGELAARFTVNSSTQLTAIVPRAASTQPISVTTPGGHVLSATAFVPTRASTNAAFALVASNFGGVSGSANAAPAVGDLDNDQLLDLLVGRADGTVSRYEQTALNASTFTSLGSLSTSAGTINVGSQATVALVDLDGDGRFSVLLGKSNGTVDEYEQASVGAAQFALVLTNVGNISTGGNAAPNATDFDGNGLLDIIAGKNDGIISQSEQNQPNTDSFYRIDTNFSGIQLSSNTAPFCVDLDGNGRLDMLVGVGSGGLYHYEQTTAGANQVRLVTSSFNNISAGSNAKPCVTDIDGDGRLDLLVGRGDGTIDRYEQVENIVISSLAPPSGPVGQAVTITGTGLGTLTSVQFGEVSARFTIISSTQVTTTVPRLASTSQLRVASAGLLVLSGTKFNVTRPNSGVAYTLATASLATNGSASAVPVVADLDGDGRLDLLLGRADGSIAHYAQTAANATTFALVTNGFGGINVGGNAAPALTDLDGDGRLDLVVGRADGTLNYYEQNAPNSLGFTLSAANYLGISTGGNSAPAFTDLNGDGRLELLIGKTDGSLGYFEQTATRSADFTRLAFTFNNLSLGAGSSPKPFVTDLDGDGLLDVLLGKADGTVARYEQTSANATTVTLVTASFAGLAAGSNAAATLTDVDGDGNLDLLLGRGDGSVARYEQVPPNTAPTNSSLSPSTVAENVAAGSTVGTFSTTDAEGGPFTYALVSGGADNGSFGISGSSLLINVSPDFETKSSYAIRVRSTDAGGLSFERAFTITITDVAEVPTVSSFSPASGLVGASVTINGSNFQRAGAATVKFNGTAATAVTVNSDAQLTATVPAGATTGTLSVTNLDGTGTSTGTFTVIVPAPNTTIVSGPPTIGNNSTVSFVFSSDQSPVDYTTSGAPNATYTGNGPNSAFGPIPDGTYTLSVAARNTSTNVSDPTPATYTFTVDATAPTVVVSSAAGASGGLTGTTPIPFAITFSENVTGFDVPDVTVTGGTFTASAASGTVYNISVTPASPGSVVTVSVAANVAQDAAGNGNTASNAYSLTYAPAPTITSFTPTSGPVGTSVTITGTGFFGSIAVAFNGTQVMGLTGNSTQITTTVPAGATTGAITVTTPGGTATSSTSFTVPVNQAPVVTVPATQSTPQNTVKVFSTANGNALSVADADAGSGQLYVYLAASNGGITLGSPASVTISNGTNGSGGFGLTGTLAAINNALNGLTFTPNSGFLGVGSLQVTANDQGNTGSGGAKSDSKTVTINVVDAQRPSVSVTSPAGSTGGSTGTTPIPFVITFSENVTGFDVPDVTVTGGTFTASAASGTVYNISVTPASPGSVVTVSVAANVAQDAAGNGNTASNAYSLTYAPATPSTNIVSGPPTIGNSSTVNFVFNSDQSPVVYATSGAPNATFSNNGANSSFGPIPDGTYTLSVAARNTNTGVSDPTPATYTFTIDTQRPVPVVTSTAGASGGSTGTSPIPFAITFLESVTGFNVPDVSVTGGTFTASAVSGTVYNISVTPTGPGSVVTVSVAANGATDAAGNGNTASNAYSLTYAPPTAAPVVSYPANGSTIASTTPTYTGTSPANSLVTVFVDNTSIGTATATAGGGWSLLQPSALSQTTHTVKATAQSTGGAVSGFSNSNSFTVDVTAPSAPTVSSPANSSFTSALRPAYSGTGAGGSTITVYVDNVSIGTTTIAAGGSTWSFTQPTDLAQGTHTVKVTATDGVGNVSAFSATNTFTVDTMVPTVTVSSTVGASGSTTSIAPVPFTIIFSEPVMNFVLGDITVSSGTPGSFVMVSASQYTFSVTPAGAGTITVSVAVGVAQDQAGNVNVPSPNPAFNLVYQPRPTISSLSVAAELPGMPVVVTGTGFSSASTATVGGVAATVAYTSATSLTLTVPAGAAVGSAALVVTTNGVSSSSAPVFGVLKVYDAVASCLSTASYLTTGDGAWHYLLAGGQVVAALHDTNAGLGTVGLDFLVAGSAGPVRRDAGGRYYLDRNFHLTASGGSFAGSSVEVRFYGLLSEQARLQAADPAATLTSLKATQYSGPNEDCDLTNNGAGQSRVLPLAASTPGGVPWFVAQATVADHFSEFYLTSSSTPLPVELVSFTATAQGPSVQLAWRTASEKNSARFEVERSADGRTFAKVGQRTAQGNSVTATSYAYLDAQPGPGLLYYRLRQVDMDGTAAYSPVRSVVLAQTPFSLYPNPARHATTVVGLAAGAGVAVYDALGRCLCTALADATGTAHLALPQELATGVYLVRSGGQALRLTVE